MSWIRFILTAFLTLVVLISGGVLWLVYADLSFLKPAVENYVGNITDREFTIGGKFKLDLGLRTIVVAEDVSLANSDWAGAANMVEIGHLRVEVDLDSVVRGPVVINLVEIADARISLRESEDGRNNWTFGDPEIEPDDGGGLIVPEVVSIENVAVTYSSPRLDRPLNANILSMRQRHQALDDRLDGEITATINDREIQVSTDIGPFENLLAGQAFEYAATGRFDTLSVHSSGFVDDLSRPARPAINLTVSGPDIDDLTGMLGLADYGEGSLNLDARLVPADDSLKLSLQGNLAGLQIEADGSASELQALQEARFRIDASGPHLGRFLTVFGIEHVPDLAFKVSGMVTRSDSDLLIDAFAMDLGRTSLRIDGRIEGFPGVDRANVKFSVKGADLAEFNDLLTLPDWVSGPFDLQGSIEHAANGSDQVQVAMVTPLGNLTIDGPLGNPPDYAGTRFTFAGAGESLAELSAVYPNLNPTLAEFMPANPFAASGTLAVDGSDFQLEDGRAQVGEAHIGLTGNLSRNPDRVGSRFSFTATGTDLEDLIADAASIDIQPTAFEISGRVERLRDMLRIDEVRVTGIAGTRIRVDADLGWPIAASPSIEFLVEASGPDARALPVQFETFDPGALPFDLHARSSWQSGRVTLDTMRARLGDAELVGQGVFDQPPDLSATDLRLNINVPDLSTLGALNDEPLPEFPFLLDAHFDGTTGSFVMDRMRGTLGRTEFDGNLGVDLSGSRPQVDTRLTFRILDLRDWFDDTEADANYNANADADGVIADYRLPLEYLAQLDGSLNISAGEVRLEATTFTDAVVSATLADATLHVSELDMKALGGRLDGTLLVLPTDPAADSSVAGSADVHFTLNGEDVQLNLTGENEEDVAAAPVYDLNIDLTGRGATARDLAATLNGHVRLLSDGGRIRNAGLAALFGGFTRNLIGTVNPFSKSDPYTRITCAIVPLTVKDGILTTAPRVFIASGKINLMSVGTVDLRTERINFSINTRTRTGIGVSASELMNPFVRVAGTLAKPSLSLDKQGTAISSGAALITGGLSILARASWDRVFRAKDPCGRALAEARSVTPARIDD